jgi:hypothetical protein
VPSGVTTLCTLPSLQSGEYKETGLRRKGRRTVPVQAQCPASNSAARTATTAEYELVAHSARPLVSSPSHDCPRGTVPPPPSPSPQTKPQGLVESVGVYTQAPPKKRAFSRSLQRSVRSLSSLQRQILTRAPELDTADHPVFGKPLKESLRYASVQISTANANGDLYVWGYIPVVVAKWSALFSPSCSPR